VLADAVCQLLCREVLACTQPHTHSMQRRDESV
jgi:hypothetical protein